MSRATIFAPATAAGKAGVAVVRVSGPRAGAALKAIAGRVPPARLAARVRLLDPAGGEPIDDALVLWFPGPGSFTGEDVAEFHIHGSRATLAALLEALGRMPQSRLAEPGEFARRAFEAGKLDLSQVEGLADLIAAETHGQARQALRQLGGALGRAVEELRARVMRLRALAEAEIDFPDEGDVPGGLGAQLGKPLGELAGEIANLLASAARGERLRAGFTVAILGAPNAGKSSLLNRLAGREAAIVSETAGTTRDVIEVHLDLGGWPVTLWDTAGLREGIGDGDPHRALEAEGMRRARRRAAEADLRLVVVDASAPSIDGELAALAQDGIVVFNKCDLARAGDGMRVCALTGEGFAALEAELAARAGASLGGGAADAPVLTRARHRAALEDVRGALERAAKARAPELVAEELRTAAHALGRIVGRTGVEDLLDVLFAEFCIGK
ncbi:MAG: tRNA uridine-5-carboxymethylaminomethyl(34) synthesis GTPase MnmE [Alphaproteobacteria bacterium]|nr:tRNA uridine-5-carboxymethylaminomethyl(34) synthesis GTPase MnmE [Alphaproteobacteria bacterium]